MTYELLKDAQDEGISALHTAIRGLIEAERCIGELGIETSEMTFILGYLRAKLDQVVSVDIERYVS